MSTVLEYELPDGVFGPTFHLKKGSELLAKDQKDIAPPSHGRGSIATTILPWIIYGVGCNPHDLFDIRTCVILPIYRWSPYCDSKDIVCLSIPFFHMIGLPRVCIFILSDYSGNDVTGIAKGGLIHVWRLGPTNDVADEVNGIANRYIGVVPTTSRTC